jgi:hypothetical protein
MIRWKRSALYIVLATSTLSITLSPLPAFAQQAVSPAYSVDEVFFGTGGQLCDPGVTGYSANYCASSSAGATAVGNTASPTYQADAGFNTNREEYIEVMLNNPVCPSSGSTSINLGYLSTSTAKTAMTYFSVKTYLSSGGYVVTTVGAAPAVTSGNSHTLATPNIGVSSNPAGTEQFGINLAANTTPSVGAAPTQVPDSSFSFGQGTNGYGTANAFKYVNGDVIANSNAKSSGTTCYTMSYLYNISSATPAGEYRFNQSIVATTTY